MSSVSHLRIMVFMAITDKIIFFTDRIVVRGPNVDGGFTFTACAGEYHRDVMSDIMRYTEAGRNYQITIEEAPERGVK